MANYAVTIGGNPTAAEGPTTDTLALGVTNPASTAGAAPVFRVDPTGIVGGAMAATSALATGNTITPAGKGAIFTTAGAITGVIMAAGLYDGQEFTLQNNSANSITFAAVGTSRVADGASAVIAANTQMKLTWNAASSLWFHGN